MSYQGIAARLAGWFLHANLYLGVLAILGRAPAPAQDIEYGGVFNDGGTHVVPPNLTAHDPFLVQGTSQVGALVSLGSHLRVLGSGRIDVNENSIGDATGIRVMDNATAEVLPGGRIDIIESSTGSAWGLVAENLGSIDFRGTMTIDEQGNSDITIGLLSGSALLDFGGTATATEEGNGTVTGFRLSESARLRFSGTMNLYESGNSDVTPLWANGDSRIEYSGTLYLQERSSSESSGSLLTNNARMLMSGGSLTLDTNRIGGSQPFFTISEDAVLVISGGSLRKIEGGVDKQPFMRLLSNSELRIHGRYFNYPLGPVYDPAGVVTGVLRDGTPFTYQFTREEKADLLLIPEPGAGLLGLNAIAGCLSITRRQRHGCSLLGGWVARCRPC